MTHRPDVRYGDGAAMRVPQVVREQGAHRVLLVCGRHSFEASGAAKLLPELETVAEVRRWSDFAPNTDAADLLRGLRLAEEFSPDLVLAVGGGSAMDMAKLLVGLSGSTDPARLHAAIRAGAPAGPRKQRLVLVPTTSGSGSEATHFAVVYIADEKFSVAGPVLRPDVTVLDPTLSRSGSRYQRATSGVDAVAQAIESLWAVAATEPSRRWARHALGLLMPAIETYVNTPTDAAARAMAIGSHLAGRAIDISRTTAAHALSYGITKRYGVSHGHAVGLTLGAFIELHGEAGGGDPVREVQTALGATSPAQARQRFEDLLARLGLATRLSEVGVTSDEAVERLAAQVNAERLGNNPVPLSPGQLVSLLQGVR